MKNFQLQVKKKHIPNINKDQVDFDFEGFCSFVRFVSFFVFWFLFVWFFFFRDNYFP